MQEVTVIFVYGDSYCVCCFFSIEYKMEYWEYVDVGKINIRVFKRSKDPPQNTLL